MKLGIITALLLVSGSAGTTAAAALVLIPVGELQEHFEKTVPVAGSMLVGLRRGPAEGPLSLQALAVDLPDNAGGMLCLDMSTRDGRYTASQDFKLQGPKAGPVSLNLKSRHPEDLRGYADADLAVMLQLRDSCDEGAPRAYLAARWTTTATEDTLTALVNVKLSRANMVLVDSAGQQVPGEEAPCQAITSGARTAYDHECSLLLKPGMAATAKWLRIDTTAATGARHSETYAIALAR
jgi:hypothetical protein